MLDIPPDLSHVPQIDETIEEKAKRLQWFRDAKFGMFIHWGPCSVGQKEIGWDRDGNRPWDINRHGPRTDDPQYDSYYKKFNPVKYDPEAWVQFAKASGMKYMVLITKHHDGFSMFDTKLSDYNIMNSPYGKDIVKGFVDACHEHDMKCGLYYSTRDWYHPDYLVGDNVKYDAWYRGQVEELLTNYGRIDLMWYDHVGGRDWGKWRFDELFSMMYRLQPNLLVNNRAAKFCGPESPEDREPASPEIAEMAEGDFYTPEGRVGSMDIERDWESCIHVGPGWSYRGETDFKGPEECIKMLVSSVTGGGNLLLNFGPRPDGTFTEGEAAVARAAGDWLDKYGDAIYGTRGGPYVSGPWGGSCHKGNKLFLHIYEWPHDRLGFDPLPVRVLSAKTLSGTAILFSQDQREFVIQLPESERDTPVTVVELTMDQPLAPGRTCGTAHSPLGNLHEYGHLISEKASLALSSTSSHDKPDDHTRLFTGERTDSGYAFCTGTEENPWVEIDLGAVRSVKAVVIENRPGDQRSNGLILSISNDGEGWAAVWKAEAWCEKWEVELFQFHAGIEVAGRSARFLKLELKLSNPGSLMLQRVQVYGQ